MLSHTFPAILPPPSLLTNLRISAPPLDLPLAFIFQPSKVVGDFSTSCDNAPSPEPPVCARTKECQFRQKRSSSYGMAVRMIVEDGKLRAYLRGLYNHLTKSQQRV